MRARMDFSRYPAGAEKLQNFLIDERGGIFRRAGTRYVAGVKSAENKPRLIEFVPDADNAFLLEFGGEYVRFFKDQAQITVPSHSSAISNGTFATDLTGWTDSDTGSGVSQHSASNGGCMSLNGGGTGNTDIAAREQAVSVAGGDQSTVHVLKFRVIADYGPVPIGSGSKRGLGGEWMTLRIGTSSGGEELLADTNFGRGYHTVEFTPGAGTVYIRFQHRWRNKAIFVDDVSFHAAGALELTHTIAQADIAATDYDGTEDVLYFAHGSYHPYVLKHRGDRSWSWEQVAFIDGPWLDENTDSTLTLTPGAGSGTGVTLTAARAFFTTSDVGRLVRQRNGTAEAWAIIVEYTSATAVKMDIITTWNNAGSSTWQMGAWGGTRGYPKYVAFYKQRSIWGGTDEQPATIWGSQVADIENMRPDSLVSSALTVEDDDAFSYTLVEGNSIVGISAARDLLVLTSGGEVPVQSSGGQITPTDVNATMQTTYGSNGVKPNKINSVTVFVQRGGRRLLRIGYDIRIEGYAAEDLTILSEHITRSGVVRLAHQQEPNSIIWCALADGTLAAMTFHPEQQVAGWSKHVIGGKFNGRNAAVEDVAVVPGGETAGDTERDEVWLLVKRTINGSTARYIEFMERDFDEEDAVEDACFCDSALTDNNWNTDASKTLTLGSAVDPDDDTLWEKDDTVTMSASGHTPFASGDVGEFWPLRYKGAVFLVEITAFSSSSSVTVRLTQDCPRDFRAAPIDEWLDPANKVSSVSGLSHLEGETVQVLGDGAVQTEKTVSSGAITLDDAAGCVTVGLKYESRWKSLRLEAGGVLGTVMGKPKKIEDITLELFAATSFKIGPRFDDDAENEGRIGMTTIPTREGGDPIGIRAKLWTKEYALKDFPGRWESDARICLLVDEPRPFFILAAAPSLFANEVV